MTMWHFLAAVEGFGRANWNLKDAPDAMSVEKLRKLGVDGF